MRLGRYDPFGQQKPETKPKSIMKNRSKLLTAILFAVLIPHGLVRAQTTPQSPAPTPSAGAQGRVLGEVTAIELNAGRMTLKTAQGEQVVIVGDDKTVYRRVPPGEKTLDKAVVIGLKDISVGDRVIARGGAADAGRPLLARSVIVIDQQEIARKKERDRAEWQSRGVEGVVAEVKPETNEVRLVTQSAEGPKSLIIAAGGSNVRRYAPDSIRYSDAVSSKVGEMKAGDRLRALGDRSGDGARFTAEEIVFGSIRMSGGFVTAVDAATGEIKINDIPTRQSLTIVVNNDSMLRRLPPSLAQQLVTAGAGSAAEAGGRVAEFQKLIERQPPGAVGDLKVGDAVLASTTPGTTPSRVSAIIMLTGVDGFLKQHMQQPKARDFNLTLGLPIGVGP